MSNFNERVTPIQLRKDEKVFLNIGTLQVQLIAKSKEENRALLESLFDHLGQWFMENRDHIAAYPALDGSSYMLAVENHEDIAREESREIGDTFPEEWLQ